MSITCSIPGCNGRHNPTKQIKLYRIPAVPKASSGFIHELSNNRRQKWMGVLHKCGLTEENSAHFRVCSNHFTEGKPAPTFDSKNPDWVPHINLTPHDEDLLVIEKRKGRPRKKDIAMGPGKSKSQSRSKSTSQGKTPETLDPGRSKSVSRGRKPKSDPTEEKKDSPFVFVDIQKIKEGVSISDITQTTTETNKSIIYRSLRSFGTQTNPNILPPINWGRNKSKKQDDPRFRSTGVQVNTINEELSEVCLGEMIDYVRKHMLEFIFAPFGKNYKITECAIHLEKQISSENQEVEKSVVIIQSNKLLSSNWPLLETIAKSLDLYKKDKKKEKNNTGLVRTCAGKKETLDYLSNLLAKKVERIAKGQMQDFSKSPDTSPPVTPKISINTSMDDPFRQVEDKKPNSSANLIEMPSIVAVPKVTNLSEQNRTGKKRLAAKRTKSRKIDVFKKLGTTKVPKILLTKLPDSVVNAARNGSTISVSMLKSPKDLPKNTDNDCQSETNPIPVVPPVPNPLIQVANQVNTPPPLCLASALNPTMSTVKNIPLKLPEKQGIAGYIVLSKPSTASNPYVYVVPGAQLPQDQSKTPESALSHLFATPSTAAIATTTVTPVFPITSTPIVNMIAPVVDQNVTNIASKMPSISPKTTNVAPISSVGCSKTSVVSPKRSVVSPKTSVVAPKPSVSSPKRSVSGSKTSDVDAKTPVAVPKTPVGSPHKMNLQVKTSPGSSGVDNSLRCPYCKSECKDGVEFIIHYKTCKGKRTNSNVLQKCERCQKFYAKSQQHTCQDLAQPQLLYCNVCGRGFIKCANLGNHVKIHPEYSIWPHKCLQCPRKFETEKLLQEHGEQCEMLAMNKKTYPCNYCKKIFIMESRLESHIKNVHLNKTTSPSTGKNVKVKCRRCENIFDLKYYRSTHWKLCKPPTESDDDEADKKENITKTALDRKIVPDFRTKMESTNKIQLVKKTETIETFKGADYPENSVKAVKEKKMTAIRSFPFETSSDDGLGASIEDQLQKMFQDDVGKPKCEQVKLKEDFEEKIAQNEINTETRKRKLQETDKSYNEYEDLLEIKVSKMNDGNLFNETLSNGVSVDEINTEIDGEVCLQSTFDMTDCSNEISFEEVEDVEYCNS